LASICRAVGRTKINDSAELHKIPCIIKVKIRPAKGEYEASNDIVSYKSIEEGQASAVATTGPAGPPPWAPKD